MYDFDLEFARGGAFFTSELFRLLAAESAGTKENIFFSPFSVQLCVALAYAGAEGETASEIAKGLRFASDLKPEVASTFRAVLEKYKGSPLVKIANKLYVQEGNEIKPSYKSAIADFDAEADSVNFGDSAAAAGTINSWVASKTNNKIDQLVTPDSLSALTRLVLLNAIHFKGDWQSKFDEANTAEDDFWIGAEESVKTAFMYQKETFPYGYFEDLNCTAIDLPYKDSDLSLLVLLPQERDGLKSLAEKLKEINLIDLAEQMSNEEVEIKLPKFKVEYARELTQSLQKLGINKLFGESAELDNLLESPESLFVSNVFHKACIEVNEEGSEAAAATGMIMMTRCMLMPLQFHADRPFLYFIWNKKNILFAGAYVNAA